MKKRKPAKKKKTTVLGSLVKKVKISREIKRRESKIPKLSPENQELKKKVVEASAIIAKRFHD